MKSVTSHHGAGGLPRSVGACSAARRQFFVFRNFPNFLVFERISPRTIPQFAPLPQQI